MPILEKMIFSEFPREVGPPRKVVHNKKQYYDYINTYNGCKKAIYSSIYKFNKIRKRGNFEKADYELAEVDKLYFDFDDKSCDAYKNCYKLHKDCERRKLKHVIIMSGRGYHLYIFVEPKTRLRYKKEAIREAQMSFINRLKLIVDRQVIGNPAQMARIPNTFHIKANRFCIPLNKTQFEKGDKFCKELASKQNFIKDIYIGDKLLDISKFDNKPKDNFMLPTYIKPNKNLVTAISIKNIPPCITEIMKNPKMGYKDRYLVISFFRDRGYFIEEVSEILKKILSPHKLHHCIKEERQLQYLFNRHDLVFPSCKQLLRRGKCTGKCKFFENVVYK